MQSRNDYLEALGIPDFLYSKVDSTSSISSPLSIMVLELSLKDSFCEAGKTRDLLVKMLASIGLDLNSVHLASIEKSNLDIFIADNPAQVVLVMDSTFKSDKSSLFSTYHPRDVIKDSHLKRETWEILKKVKQCLK
jgi:predicted permease